MISSTTPIYVTIDHRPKIKNNRSMYVGISKEYWFLFRQIHQRIIIHTLT